jgi:hypothetical protein
MIQEAVEAIEAVVTRVFTFAPSADASRGVLRHEGFANADTVARLLLDERLQTAVRGQAIWVDEAGLLGTRTMAQVFDLGKKLDARVILSGDPKQHGSVERGAALRLLEDEAGVVPAEIKEIQRQKGEYKRIVQALSEGRTDVGFCALDKLGWIRQAPDDERYKALAADYIGAVSEGKTALVVSPTHREGDRITGEIRSELKRLGRVGRDEHSVLALASTNLTDAERRDLVNYSPGDVLVFHQNAKGITKGTRVNADGRQLPLDQAERFHVFHTGALTIAPRNLIRITRNGSTADGKHRLNNGAVYSVERFDHAGNIVLANGWTVSRDYGHLAYGYVVTSHASQGKTVDRVIIGQSLDSLRASSSAQFYVSVSRGREQAIVYTDDKQALLEAVKASDNRLTATELMREHDMRERGATLHRAVNESREDVQRPELEREALVHDR